MAPTTVSVAAWKEELAPTIISFATLVEEFGGNRTQIK